MAGRSSRRSHVEPTAMVGGLFLVTIVLMAVGVVMVTSATLPIDRVVTRSDFWRTVFGRQAVFFLGGLLTIPLSFWLSKRILASDYWCRVLPVALFAISMIALLITLVPTLVDAQHGSRRWLRWTSLGIGVQPSELVKISMVGLLAYMLTRGASDLRSFRQGFVPVAGVVGLSVLFVGKEDFGTAALIGLVGFFMLMVGGVRPRHLVWLTTVGMAALACLLYFVPYRWNRLVAFLDIWSDAQGSGYQPIQSLTAIASGGLFGTGLGAGIQKFGYLPEAHSDFVFSIICEETGLIGGAIVIALFCSLVWLGMNTVRHASTRFEGLLAFGIVSAIGFQAAMNIAVATVVAPTTGISLPFISAGGTSLIVLCTSVGVLAAVAARAGGPQGCDGRAAVTSRRFTLAGQPVC